MPKLIIRWIILTIAIAATAYILPGVTVTGGAVGMLVIAAIFGLVNAFIRPILKLLTCPLVVLTLGLFTFVINAFLFWLTAQISTQVSANVLLVDSFWTAFLASIIVSIISAVLNIFVSDD